MTSGRLFPRGNIHLTVGEEFSMRRSTTRQACRMLTDKERVVDDLKLGTGPCIDASVLELAQDVLCKVNIVIGVEVDVFLWVDPVVCGACEFSKIGRGTRRLDCSPCNGLFRRLWVGGDLEMIPLNVPVRTLPQASAIDSSSFLPWELPTIITILSTPCSMARRPTCSQYAAGADGSPSIMVLPWEKKKAGNSTAASASEDGIVSCLRRV